MNTIQVKPKGIENIRQVWTYQIEVDSIVDCIDCFVALYNEKTWIRSSINQKVSLTNSLATGVSLREYSRQSCTKRSLILGSPWVMLEISPKNLLHDSHAG